MQRFDYFFYQGQRYLLKAPRRSIKFFICSEVIKIVVKIIFIIHYSKYYFKYPKKGNGRFLYFRNNKLANDEKI